MQMWNQLLEQGNSVNLFCSPNLNSICRRWMPLICVLGLVGFGTGCSTFSSSDDDLPTEDGESEIVTEMEVDPVLIRVTEEGGEYTTEHIAAEDVFERAYYDFQARRYDSAAENYQLIVDYFDESRFYLPALYNGGLAYEELDLWREAANSFRIIVEEFADADEALNARFRLAKALHELGEYNEVDELLLEVLLQDGLDHFDRVEAHVRRGQALLELEQWNDAENSFRNVLESNREAIPSDRLDDDSRFIVLTHFGIGQANHGRMNDIPLLLPPERMREDLDTKADYHQSAQVAYIRALREHHPHWSVAAGYKIGRLYQDFYMDIFTAEIPDDLTEEELAFYFEELRNKIEVLMDRALTVYERNLSFSRRVARSPDAEDWVQATALHLERMRAFLDDPLVQEHAERLVLQDGDLEQLWDPGYYARIHVGEALEQAVEISRSAGGEELARR